MMKKIPSDTDILIAAEAFLLRTGMTDSAFGVAVNGDRALMLTLRRGRRVSLETARKILTYIDMYKRPKARHQDRAGADA